MADVVEPGLPPMIRAGIASSRLIADPAGWINRRVETIESLSHEETRRRVSIDFTLIGEDFDELHIRDGVVVPISVLTKEARRNFDLRDESGRAVPVLGKEQNGELAHIAVMSAAAKVLPDDVDADLFEKIAAELRQVVFGSPAHAAEELGAFIGLGEDGDRWRAAVWEDDICRSLLVTLWNNYVLFAVISSDGPNRRVLKYSYGDDFDLTVERGSMFQRLRPSDLLPRVVRPDRRRIVIGCPGAWRAASFHAEVAVPEELRFDRALLYDFATDEPVSLVDVDVNRASLYASRELEAGSDIAAYVEIAPERSGRTSQAAATTAIVAALLWLGVGSGLNASNPGPAVSILLAGAALFSGLTAVQGEHKLVKNIFSASRRWLLLTTTAALAASASLAMEVPDAHPVALWRVVAVASTLAAARLSWSAIRAPA